MVAAMRTKKVKPWHGKWLSRSKANKINDMFESAVVPDRTASQKRSRRIQSIHACKKR